MASQCCLSFHDTHPALTHSQLGTLDCFQLPPPQIMPGNLPSQTSARISLRFMYSGVKSLDPRIYIYLCFVNLLSRKAVPISTILIFAILKV